MAAAVQSTSGDVAPHELLAKVFGQSSGPDPFNVRQVGSIIERALADEGVRNIAKPEARLTYQLAPDYANNTSESIKAMDEHLKVILAGTLKLLGQAIDKKGEQLSWEDVTAIMAQNPLVVPDGEPIYKNEESARRTTDVFLVDGHANDETINQYKQFFRSVVADENVLRASYIADDKVLNDLARIPAETGVHIGSLETFFAGKEYAEKEVLDIGVLRFPAPSTPYVQVYRLKVKAYRSCNRVLMVEVNNNGLAVEFTSRRYKPNEEVLADMKPEVKKKAVAEAESIFG